MIQIYLDTILLMTIPDNRGINTIHFLFHLKIKIWKIVNHDWLFIAWACHLCHFFLTNKVFSLNAYLHYTDPVLGVVRCETLIYGLFNLEQLTTFDIFSQFSVYYYCLSCPQQQIFCITNRHWCNYYRILILNLKKTDGAKIIK